MAQLIGYTLGAMFDPILIIICVATGFLIKNYGLSVLVGCLVVIPLNVALISSLGSSPSPMFFMAKPIAVAAWCGLFFWIASNKRKKKEQ